jgi:hypothetical protein
MARKQHIAPYRLAVKVAIAVSAVVMAAGLFGLIFLDQSVAMLAVVIIAWAVLEDRWAEPWYGKLNIRQPDDLFYGVTSYLVGRAFDLRSDTLLAFNTPFIRLGLYLLAIYFVWRAFRKPARAR